MTGRRLLLTLAGLLPLFSFQAQAQGSSAPAHPVETVNDLISRLTPEQAASLRHAEEAMYFHHLRDGLDTLKPLVAALPGDPVLSKMAAETALDLGERSYALSIITPVAAANNDDWGAAVLVVRGCAETGDTACRNSAMAHMIDLYQRGLSPPSTLQYLVERLAIDENTLNIFTSLTPWGLYKVHHLGRITGAKDETLLTVTLENSDSDQELFQKMHPEQAAAGMRRFSYDGYRGITPVPRGKINQTRFTYKLFDGREPSYASVRAEFIEIASGMTKPASRSGKAVAPRAQ